MGNKRKQLRERNSRDPRTKSSKVKRRPKIKPVSSTGIDNDVVGVVENVLPEESSSAIPILTAAEKKLRPVRRVIDDSPNGESPNGEIPDGESPDGESPDGESPYGESQDGESPDGESPDGESPYGESPDGESPDGESPDSDEDETRCADGYLLIDIGLLFPLFDDLVKCKRCGFQIESSLQIEKKQGFAHVIHLSCLSRSCQWKQVFYTSKTVKKSSRGADPFDINLRSIMAFREIGKGHAGMKRLCGLMNMPPPMAEITYNETMKNKLSPAYVDLANENMERASIELRQEVSDNYDEKITCDVAVSCDGSWQSRGFASLNGIVSAISIDTGKCLAFECLVKTCKSCEMWSSQNDTVQYENFIKEHVCPINHVGSAGAMEASGVVKMFSRSVDTLKLRFTKYIGDGDSKAFSSVVASEPYGPLVQITKGECIGHIQKRVGGRLIKYKRINSGKVLMDGKKIGGPGRLTAEMINKLQNYFGLAIRQNTDSLVKMRKSVGAVIYHCSKANSLEARHMFCDDDSKWCGFKMNLKAGIVNEEKPGLPIAVRDEIIHIFRDLSSEDLLKKCLHGKTQNNNESLNGFIWKRLPKDIFVGYYTLLMGVSSAVIDFNSGATGLYNVYEKLDMIPGCFTEAYIKKHDDTRICRMKRKMSAAGIRYRKKRKGFQDKNKEKEGSVYKSGMF